MNKWRRAIVFDGIRLFQLITWGIALIIITACGHNGTVHWAPSPAPNVPPISAQS